MPIYEYRCANCGFQKEYLQKLSDAPLTDCPECGKAALSKMVTAAGFHLKGSGWYVTDFKNGAKAKPAEKVETKADDKPAAKEETAPAAATSAAPAKTETPAAKPAAPAATPVADS